MKTKILAVIMPVLVAGIAAVLTGCGTVAAHFDIANSRIVQGAQVNGAPAVGVNPFGLVPTTAGEWVEQLGGVAIDCATAYVAYRLYERGQNNSDNTAATPVVIPNISTGQQSPVIIIGGNGTVHQNVPTTVTNPTATRRK